MAKWIDISAGASPWGFTFSTDGTYLFFTDDNNDRIYRYTLSTAWDINSATLDASSLSIGAGTQRGVIFKSDGSRFWWVDISNDRVYQYSLTVPWSLTGGFSSDGWYDTTGDSVLSPVDISFSNDGLKLFVTDLILNAIVEYDLGTAWDVTGTVTLSANSGDVSTQQPDPFALYMQDGTENYVFSADNANTINRYSCTSAYDMSTFSYDTGQEFAFTEGSNSNNIWIKPDGTLLWVHDATNKRLYEYRFGTPWDVTTLDADPFIPTDSVFFDPKPEIDSDPYSIVWKDDGYKFYVLEDDGEVWQYSVPIAFDLRNASYDGITKAPTELSSTCLGMYIGDSGTKLFILDTSNDLVYRYTMSTAWDLSTLVAPADHSYSVTAQETTPAALGFSDDGTKMYVYDSSDWTVSEYALTTAWDLSGTVTWNDSTSISTNSRNAGGQITFLSDGLTFYIRRDGAVTENFVNQYDLSVAWDISTLSYTDQFSVNSETTAPAFVSVLPDGTRFWVGDLNSSNYIHQYDMGTPGDITTGIYKQPIVADGAVTLAQTVSGTASTNHLYADGAVTLAQTVSGTGRVSLRADGAVSITPTVSAGATNSTLHCDVAVTVTPEVTATGTGTNHADGAVILSPTILATGGTAPPIATGAVSITPTVSAESSVQYAMRADVSLPALTSTGVIEYNVITLPALTSTGRMTVADVASMTLPALTAAGTMIPGNNYAGDPNLLRLPALQAFGYTANYASMTIPALTATGSLLSSNNAASDIRLPAMQAVGAMGDARLLDADLTLPALVVSRGTLVNAALIQGNARIPALRAFGRLASGTVITGSVELPALELDSVLLSEGLLTADLTIPAMEAIGYITYTATLTPSGWAFNTESMRTSEYQNYDYLMLNKVFGKTIGVAADGIYELTGDTDNTVNIDADVLFGLDSFRTEDLKRVKTVHLGYRADNEGDLNVQIVVDGEEKIREYTVRHISSVNGIKRGRATIAKGLKSRYWQYGLKNVAGADFFIDDLSVFVQQHNRKAQ